MLNTGGLIECLCVCSGGKAALSASGFVALHPECTSSEFRQFVCKPISVALCQFVSGRAATIELNLIKSNFIEKRNKVD